MSIKRRIEKLELKRLGGLRVVSQKNAEQPLIDNPPARGESLVIAVAKAVRQFPEAAIQ
ncbi:MAG: hypothetical protein JKY31_08430 [Rhodobacteraceae bacterium]|nr:hypothetical protein [Paracoccaceae bacterium]